MSEYNSDKNDLLKNQRQTWSDNHINDTVRLVIEKENQAISFRKSFKKHLLWLLYIEIGVLYTFMALQGFNIWGFKLNDIVFGVFANAVIIQTFFSLSHVIKHLFPKQDGEDLLSKIFNIVLRKGTK
jgi:hypothetical protein